MWVIPRPTGHYTQNFEYQLYIKQNSITSQKPTLWPTATRMLAQK